MHSLTVQEPGPTRILIAEGEGLVRAGLRLLVEREEGVVVIAEAASADEAVGAARATSPHVVLMDLDLPDAGGIETASRIVESSQGETRIVMLMSAQTDEAVFGALRAGVTGVLLRDGDPEELAEAVRVVARGEAQLAPWAASRLVADFMAQPDRPFCRLDELDELTAREREVVRLVARGLTNEEIAEHLVITHATAKTHVSRALRKLDARDRAQLVAIAYETGLVRPRPPGPVAAEPAHADRRATWRPALRSVAA
jgi:DNA-binding NarL/FixJ family response regulator